jgi:hypothetical protein
MAKRICKICKKPMGNSWHIYDKHIPQSYVHIHCEEGKSNDKHTIMCSCGKLAIECKEASYGLNTFVAFRISEVFWDIKDILENYKGDYFKININKLNDLEKRHISNFPNEMSSSKCLVSADTRTPSEKDCFNIYCLSNKTKGKYSCSVDKCINRKSNVSKLWEFLENIWEVIK